MPAFDVSLENSSDNLQTCEILFLEGLVLFTWNPVERVSLNRKYNTSYIFSN